MNYLIKTEINGIQDFIFNIKSTGAARALKARSFFVDAICQLIAHSIVQAFQGSNVIFAGGGNVYAKIPSSGWGKDKWNDFRKNVQSQLLEHHLYCNFAVYEYTDQSYGKALVALNTQMQKAKLQPSDGQTGFFAAFHAPAGELTKFTQFSSTYSKNRYWTIQPHKPNTTALITDDKVLLNGYSLQLQNDKGKALIPMPIWTDDLVTKFINSDLAVTESKLPEPDLPKIGNIITFKWLTYFAKDRTGTGKLAVLKLDIDNLGKTFQLLKDEKPNHTLSNALNNFFASDFISLLNEQFEHNTRVLKNGEPNKRKVAFTIDNKQQHADKYDTQKEKHRYINNIYTVYAGGDDCFVIGAWDAIVNFAIVLQHKFNSFQANLIKQEALPLKGDITLSAAIMLIDQHFPVVRFAELANEALDDAKRARHNNHLTDAAGLPMKSCINFMGHVFAWRDFAELSSVKDTFAEMVLAWDAPKAFLQRIIHSFESDDNFYWHNCSPPKPFDPALLWRFMYSFRDIRHTPFFKAEYLSLFFGEQGYERKYVWNNFNENKTLSLLLPVAARWTELLTKQ